MTSPSTALTHGCVRCGTPIPLADAMCEACNPLGLRQPAASQAHGTVFAGIFLAVIVLAVLARATVAGVGPFEAAITDVTAAPDGLVVTIEVTNAGSAGSPTMCRIGDPSLPGIGPETAYVQSPLVEPGRTRTFQATVRSLGTEPRELSVSCGDRS
ncbi:MAG TPA: hypothetical protein VFK35_11145 [Candidatus Limnocylindrales bacterium]|nr:hypothetical protein [Candidatus Limnocylindrales bacterium]